MNPETKDKTKWNVSSLEQVDWSFVSLRPQKGVLGCHKDPFRAHGVYFTCPKCTAEPGHGVTLLFNHQDVPEEVQPLGRWTVLKLSRDKLGLKETIKSPVCDITGHIRNGELRWR